MLNHQFYRILILVILNFMQLKNLNLYLNIIATYLYLPVQKAMRNHCTD